jgi:hypothetical protein
MANAQIIPDTQAINLKQGVDSIIKFVPKNSLDNTVFDCTQYTAALDMRIGNASGILYKGAFVLAAVLFHADNTGLIVTVPATVVNDFVNTMNMASGTGYLMATDSNANTALIWEGSLQVVTNPTLYSTQGA